MKDQYLINMQFAEELFQFLFYETPLFDLESHWSPRFPVLEFENRIIVSLFNEEVGLSVFYIINQSTEDIVACYDDFCSGMNPIDRIVANFARCALSIAPLFFSEGYNHGAFLGYCAMVMGVAYHFLFLDPNDIPERACQVIGLVLFTHQMTGEFYKEGGWGGLLDASLNFNKCIENPKKKRKGKH